MKMVVNGEPLKACQTVICPHCHEVVEVSIKRVSGYNMAKGEFTARSKGVCPECEFELQPGTVLTTVGNTQIFEELTGGTISF